MKMETSMYDTLLQLPLFQGLGKEDFTKIIEKVKFHFNNFHAGEILMEQDDACNCISFLLKGEISSQTFNARQNYRLTEVLKAPFIIEPYSLFGMQPFFTATYKAHTDATLLTIDKSFVLSELNQYDIFRINYLNILSNRCQQTSHKLRNIRMESLTDKFVDFFLLRCISPKGTKSLHITMEELAVLIGETRINVSRLLNELQHKGLIQLKRKEIFIPAFEKLDQVLGQ